jgi:hypothetical protein
MQPERSTEKGAFVMIHIPHELRDEFPKEAHFIERLIKTDYEFGRLAASYDERDSALSLVRASEAVNKSRAIEQVVADLQAAKTFQRYI